ncbi:MAG: YqaE/Pmp3 family membrane protein [Proteobacteria bacterium]|nr:YqaE/Pmp3 family membrane protein [Pseudomonadota bacterium]MDA1311397.1 YqaE/Pmp3 family membrane protein [Pseudomonadota bacterium]
MNVIRIILALLLPPVAAFLTVGIGLHFWLNIILSVFFWVPGMIHALWLVVRKVSSED